MACAASLSRTQCAPGGSVTADPRRQFGTPAVSIRWRAGGAQLRSERDDRDGNPAGAMSPLRRLADGSQRAEKGFPYCRISFQVSKVPRQGGRTAPYPRFPASRSARRRLIALGRRGVAGVLRSVRRLAIGAARSTPGRTPSSPPVTRSHLSSFRGNYRRSFRAAVILTSNRGCS